MNSQDMKREFLILYDKITNFDAPGYEEVEISIFLTKAQERLTLSSLRAKSNKYDEGFEETEIRRKELNELVKGVDIILPSSLQLGALPNGTLYTLPDDLLLCISEEVTTSSEDACKDGKRLRIKPTTHDEYAMNRSNPFKRPNIHRYVWRLDYENNQHELITDGTFNISTYHLRYVKKLQPIIIGTDTVDGEAGPLDCELSELLHKRIVDEAVKIATGITDPEKYQIKSIEQQAGN